MQKTPVFFTSLEPRTAMLLMKSVTCFCFRECSPANCLAMAPLVMAFFAAFIAFMVFMGGSMATDAGKLPQQVVRG